MAQSLEGKTVIVAGAGGGVGRAVARRFAAAGARLMLADPDDKRLAETMDGLQGAADAVADNAAAFPHGIDDKLGVANLIAAAADRFGRIDVLVTNARASSPGGPFDLSAEDFAQVLRANVASVFLQSQMVARRMIRQRESDTEFRGALVNISSISAQRTAPELIAYSVSCAALDQLTRSLAAALAPQGIRVNGVALGAVMTSRLREAFSERADLRDEMVAVTPLGRIGEAEEAAEAALFLASPGASFITGQILAVDGGRLVLDPLASPER
ncbi:MAG TPA: SDR family oxidoreductase [Thermohalobaculum sp.]|nr:SDR family oxidoreductase [Thermohalobaculum sp.]